MEGFGRGEIELERQLVILLVILLVVLALTMASAPKYAPTFAPRGGRPRGRRARDASSGPARASASAEPFTRDEAECARAALAEARADGRNKFYEEMKDAPGRLPYRRVDEARVSTSLHNGQLKLQMGEIEFLTKYGHLSDTVVYVAAAPGVHTPYLAKLFPRHTFHLYDPAPFRMALSRHPEVADRIHATQAFFTDETAREWADRSRDRPVLLINDIRAASDDMPYEEFESRVAADNESQRRWYRIIRPAAAMIKFRWPFTTKTPTGTATYLKGRFMTQAFPPVMSAETRLMVEGPDAPDVEHDYREYEEKMFYHNLITRNWCVYQHNVPIAKDGASAGVVGLDHCYDCCRMIDIWREYMTAAGEKPTGNAIAAHINATLRTIDRTLVGKAHGRLPDEPVAERRRALGAFVPADL